MVWGWPGTGERAKHSRTEKRKEKVMSISSISGMGIYPYAGINSSGRTAKTAKTESFADEVKKAAEERFASGIVKEDAWKGDLVIPQPPNYAGFACDGSFEGKSREEMTMDEYKQWFVKETSKMPVSAWVRSTVMGGSLTVTEECFARMKEDPEWEQTVLGMVRKMYSVNGIMGSKMVGYQVIGASPEQCYGAGIPVKDGSPFSAGTEKSWWKERHEREKEQMEEFWVQAVLKKYMKI